jgi:mono/diheme cytochrome c family protein
MTRPQALLGVLLAVSGVVSACSSHAAAGSVQLVDRLMPYDVRLGRSVYDHYCQGCHGETGSGDGFNAFNLDPHPQDLTTPAFQSKKTDADLEDVIRRGGTGVGLSALMPPYGRTLTPDQISGAVLFLRTLRKEPRR